MLDTLHSLSTLTLVEIIGPILLSLAFIYGIYHTRRRRSLQPEPNRGTVYAQDRK